MAATVEKRLRRLESQLSKLNRNLDSLGKKFDSANRMTYRELAAVVANDAKIVKKIKDAEKIENTNHSENQRKIRNLEVLNKNISARITAARTETANVAAKQSAMEKSWNINVLNRTAGATAEVTKALATLEKRDSKNVRNLDKIRSGIFAISSHAANIEAEHVDARMIAKELATKAENLKDTMNHFFKQSESLNNKVNTNAAGLSELASTLEVIKDKLVALENHPTQLTELKELLDQNLKNIDQITHRIAYLEKATVKTIVLE
jgi:chromosome segregation protein